MNAESSREYAILSNGHWERVVIQTISSEKENRRLLSRIFDVPEQWLTEYLTVRVRDR